MALQTLTDRLEAYFEAHPGATMTSSEGAEKFNAEFTGIGRNGVQIDH